MVETDLRAWNFLARAFLTRVNFRRRDFLHFHQPHLLISIQSIRAPITKHGLNHIPPNLLPPPTRRPPPKMAPLRKLTCNPSPTQSTTDNLKVSILSVGNSIQAYLTLSYTSQVYLGPANASKPATAYNPAPNSPATPLQSRTFGTWTLIQSLIRLYAAYNIENGKIYQMAFLTYAVAWCHFVSEWQVFGTARWGRGLAGPLVVSTGSLLWMWMQWGFYVQ